MTVQRDLVQRSIAVPQTLLNSPLGSLVQSLQQLLAVSAEQGAAWYNINYQIFWNERPKQLIIATAILTPESDAVVMETFSGIVAMYNIQGVNAWSQPVTTLGFPYNLSTQAIATAVIQG